MFQRRCVEQLHRNIATNQLATAITSSEQHCTLANVEDIRGVQAPSSGLCREGHWASETRLAPFHGAGARSDVAALERLFAYETAPTCQLRLHPSVVTKVIACISAPSQHRASSSPQRKQLKDGKEQTASNIKHISGNGTSVCL